MNNITLSATQTRWIFAAIGVSCVALLGGAYFLQYGPGQQQPCPLCILQRYVYMAVADVAATVNPHPQFYSLEKNQIRIIGAGVGQAYTLFYTPKILPLSASVATNWILTNASELYLYASCLEGARYLRDANEIATLSQSVTLALESARRFAERRGQPSVGSLQIRPRRG